MVAQPARAVAVVELLVDSSVGGSPSSFMSPDSIPLGSVPRRSLRLVSVPQLSLIVPILNEAFGLADFLQTNLPRLPKGTEVILVDGGSADASKAITTRFPVLLLDSQPGRARQMNAGAKSATGQYLLFLHADTQLNQNFSEQFEQWVATDPVWGFSPVRLDGPQLWCRVVESSINLRTRITSGASGDQAIVLQADKFQELGGYREIDLMEDIDLSYRLCRQSKPRRFAQPVTTSNRRWVEGGVVRTVLMMWFLRLSFRFGAAPRRLARIYTGV